MNGVPFTQADDNSIDRLSDARSDEAVPITERELEVLRHVGRGRRNREIGALLGVSVPTVKNHLGSVIAKLRARSRTQAVVRAVQLRLLSLEELDPTPRRLVPRRVPVSASAHLGSHDRRRVAG